MTAARDSYSTENAEGKQTYMRARSNRKKKGMPFRRVSVIIEVFDGWPMTLRVLRTEMAFSRTYGRTLYWMALSFIYFVYICIYR